MGPRVAGVAAIAGAIALAGCGGASSGDGTSQPRTAAAVKRFTIDGTPVAAVGAAGHLWVGDQLGDALYEIDPQSGQTISRQRVGRDPYASVEAMALSGTRLWVAYGTADGDTVRAVDVRTGALGPPRKTAWDNAVAAAATPDAAFIGAPSTITRVPAAGGRPLVYTIPHSDSAHNGSVELVAIAAGRTAVWAALRNYNLHSTALVSYNPRTLRPGATIDLATLSTSSDFYATSLLASGSSVWVSSVEGTVLRITAGRVSARVDFPDLTTALLADSTGVWVAEVAHGKLDHISAASGKVDRTVQVSGKDLGTEQVHVPRTTISALPGQLWVTDYKTGTGYRITLR